MQVYSENKKAHFEYEIIEKYEAGLVLQGQEVKSIKTGHINLSGSYVVIRNNELYLIGAKIPPYQPKNTPADYNPEQNRKLLLNKKEINYLMGKVNERGFSLIPLKIYEQNGRIKLEFGLAKGKKKFDKKEKIKKRDVERDINRELSNR
ncbi:MAG: SsrA-binding protein [Candidatus Staskawiczbacteria bacterium RIFCSPHIGHO2_02_FULL_34_10]|uniref:SsrA-binding protein n=1 Tax=Candidatus Staskawiczbacteria bacterium RIFCSPHIGHO2_02_FULL_34_10 TaxID=1802205 RepID=A0A1G2HYI8_9BACT|nr:MAG: SsrA-binding protein [Candidatus Staskawiczbacteria bacterium RIFCSPHIGHO2_02_FULL_34_10]